MSDHVTLFEVGPRDGLQNEKQLIATDDKIHLINLLSECGFSKIEATSFVSPKWVPQMADASAVLAGITRNPNVSYAALTPNLKGYERAHQAGADEIAIFASASESFSQKNINCSIEESIARFMPVLAAAHDDDIPVRGYVSCVVECPYEGPIEPAIVADLVEKLFDAGCYEVSLGDTIGKAVPASISTMLDAVLAIAPANKLAGHYHDTNGNALENIKVSMDKGLRVFDSAVGGLGGCPYAPGAKGNVATGEVLTLMNETGMDTQIDIELVKLAEEFLGALFNPKAE